MGQIGGKGQDGHILGHILLYAGPKNLNRHHAPIGQNRAVGLGDGGGGYGRSKLNKQVGYGPINPGLNHGGGQLGIKGLKLILEPRQIIGEIGAQNIGSRGQKLTELDRDRTKPFEGLGETFARPSSARLRSRQQS